MINYRLFQKLTLFVNGKYNQLIIIVTTSILVHQFQCNFTTRNYILKPLQKQSKVLLLVFSIHLIILCIKIRLCTLAHNSLATEYLSHTTAKVQEPRQPTLLHNYLLNLTNQRQLNQFQNQKSNATCTFFSPLLPPQTAFPPKHFHYKE